MFLKTGTYYLSETNCCLAVFDFKANKELKRKSDENRI